MSAYSFGGIMKSWNIKQTKEFQEWFEDADDVLQGDTVEHVELLRQLGPFLKRPYADSIKGSSISNLKELRFSSGNRVIRIFYVFDPDQNGVLLIGGNKAGSGDKKFYDQMINKSEKIYVDYLEERIKKAAKEKMNKKVKKHNSDFFSNAKKVIGEKRFAEAIKKGNAKANRLRLKMARELIGLKQTELTGLSQPEVSKIESRDDIKISTLEKYAEALGMKVEIHLAYENDDDEPIAIYG